MADNLVFPGTCLGPVGECSQEDNVHVLDTLVYSTVLGTRVSEPSPGSNTATTAVRSLGGVLPFIGAVVFAQVCKISRKQAECNIFAIEGKLVQEGYKGVIMSTGIHESKTIDNTIYEWFRPGDIVKAKVISDSDVKQLVLSTAQQDLGVVKIQSDEAMIPISWKFFLGAKSGRVEKR